MRMVGGLLAAWLLALAARTVAELGRRLLAGRGAAGRDHPDDGVPHRVDQPAERRTERRHPALDRAAGGAALSGRRACCTAGCSGSRWPPVRRQCPRPRATARRGRRGGYCARGPPLARPRAVLNGPAQLDLRRVLCRRGGRRLAGRRRRHAGPARHQWTGRVHRRLDPEPVRRHQQLPAPETIGLFGWRDAPLPVWQYVAGGGLVLLVILLGLRSGGGGSWSRSAAGPRWSSLLPIYAEYGSGALHRPVLAGPVRAADRGRGADRRGVRRAPARPGRAGLDRPADVDHRSRCRSPCCRRRARVGHPPLGERPHRAAAPSWFTWARLRLAATAHPYLMVAACLVFWLAIARCWSARPAATATATRSLPATRPVSCRRTPQGSTCRRTRPRRPE